MKEKFNLAQEILESIDYTHNLLATDSYVALEGALTEEEKKEIKLKIEELLEEI